MSRREKNTLRRCATLPAARYLFIYLRVIFDRPAWGDWSRLVILTSLKAEFEILLSSLIGVKIWVSFRVGRVAAAVCLVALNACLSSSALGLRVSVFPAFKFTDAGRK